MLHKEKRDLRNIDGYWLFTPVVAPSPYRQAQVNRAERAALKPKAFANPNHHGYGGPEAPWPFDVKKAYNDGRYRAGIRNALGADWPASNWKYVARLLLLEVLQVMIENELN